LRHNILRLCAGAAYGQDRPKSLREVLEGYPGWMAMPVQHFPQIQPIPQTPPKTVLLNEIGGRIDVHWLRFQLLAQSGDEVEIRGLCPSACTLIMVHIPQEDRTVTFCGVGNSG
jgi:hypothetical protein